MRTVRIATAITLLFLSGGWGSTGHRIINGEATIHLPPEMASFVTNRTWIVDSSSVADWRRSGYNGYGPDAAEGPKHYLDVDDYPEYTSRSVPTDLSMLIASYGSSRVYGNGILPWAVGACVDSLTVQMMRGDWDRVWSTTSDLGHYVADAHNPLHCTVDYNGRSSLPGSNGIHSRYESNMINRYSGSLSFSVDTVRYVADPVSFALNFVYDSQSLVDSLYAADLAARTLTGWSGSGTAPTAYVDTLWDRTGPMTRAQFQRATIALSSLWYTAWIDAGSPVLTRVASSPQDRQIPARFTLYPPYPNPFNPSVVIEWESDQSASIRLDVVTTDGKVVATLAEGTFGIGRHQTRFEATPLGLASGVYFVRLAQADRGIRVARKLLLIR